jgi:ABC-type enterochelin transport system substrate-binding protein
VKRTQPDRRAQAKRTALNALKRARRAADLAGVDLTAWEGEFLGSVSGRIETFGRAFGDHDKGAPGAALSRLQTVKLKEIAAKARSKARGGQPASLNTPSSPCSRTLR